MIHAPNVAVVSADANLARQEMTCTNIKELLGHMKDSKTTMNDQVKRLDQVVKGALEEIDMEIEIIERELQGRNTLPTSLPSMPSAPAPHLLLSTFTSQTG